MRRTLKTGFVVKLPDKALLSFQGVSACQGKIISTEEFSQGNEMGFEHWTVSSL